MVRPHYGIDAPGIMVGFLAGGAAGVAIGLGVAVALGAHPWLALAGWGVAISALVPLFFGCLMAAYAVLGKYRTREALLGTINWRGDEQVLDVGTGAGLLLIGAAKRLNAAQASGGHATGIDIWSAKDLSHNARAATLRNIAIEGVSAKATVRDADAAQMPFADASFDVVVSLLCLHNIAPQARRDAACREIARVLRPGGRVVVGDYIPTTPYADVFARAGLRVRHTGPRFGTALSLMWFTIAERVA